MDDSEAEELVFSDRFACNICGYSLTELEPRLFSFNNPTGACSGCDGLGVKQFFDPDRVIVNSDLSLAGGAIRGWDRKTTYYFQMIKSLAAHYKFDIETPYCDLDESLQQIVSCLAAARKNRVLLREHSRHGNKTETSIRRRDPESRSPLPGNRIKCCS